ncbi:MAG: SDR family oxidoreductase [Acidimicrobiia bacterium]|nr:SDR family oxidoreductase [Acidimicrobiia bacterium]
MGVEAFRYDGKRVLVVGGASGMGAATARTAADLGAEVIVMDVADVTYPVAQSVKVDLRDRASVDAAADAVSGPVHAAFLCAGVADGTPGIMLINFIAQRHLFERLVGSGTMGPGAAAAMISSVAGLGWMSALPVVTDFLDQDGWDAAAAWVAAHDGTDNYAFSKQAINAYVAREALPLLQQGIRINAILPGPTDTPLARANADLWLTFAAEYRAAAGVETLLPEQMANVLAFLCSDAASGISGVTLLVDQGHVNASLTGAWEADAPILKMLMGTG